MVPLASQEIRGALMSTLKLISAYAAMINPFLAAVLSGLHAYGERGRFWRCAGQILCAVALVGYGVFRVLY